MALDLPPGAAALVGGRRVNCRIWPQSPPVGSGVGGVRVWPNCGLPPPAVGMVGQGPEPKVGGWAACPSLCCYTVGGGQESSRCRRFALVFSLYRCVTFSYTNRSGGLWHPVPCVRVSCVRGCTIWLGLSFYLPPMSNGRGPRQFWKGSVGVERVPRGRTQESTGGLYPKLVGRYRIGVSNPWGCSRQVGIVILYSGMSF